MNKQEIFDTVSKHLINQGCKSVIDDHCAYRGPAGTKCAVGVLIPDELYSPNMEQKNIYYLVLHSSDEDYTIPSYFAEHVDFLKELQEVHDFAPNNSFITFVKSTLKAVANKHNLNNEIANNG